MLTTLVTTLPLHFPNLYGISVTMTYTKSASSRKNLMGPLRSQFCTCVTESCVSWYRDEKCFTDLCRKWYEYAKVDSVQVGYFHIRLLKKFGGYDPVNY